MADGVIHRLVVSGGGVVDSEVGRLSGGLSGPVEQVTAVGDEVVVLSGGRVLTGSGSVDVSGFGEGAVLQAPGPGSDRVLVATETALLEVPLGGGGVVEHRGGGDGVPAAPVVVGGCVHGAWASVTAGYMHLCPGDRPGGW